MNDEPQTPNFGTHDPEVICDVTLSTGETVRGNFNYVDGACPPGWASVTLYDEPETRDTMPERWKHINPAHIVSVEVWLV
jgi:hypothetical protein